MKALLRHMDASLPVSCAGQMLHDCLSLLIATPDQGCWDRCRDIGCCSSDGALPRGVQLCQLSFRAQACRLSALRVCVEHAILSEEQKITRNVATVMFVQVKCLSVRTARREASPWYELVLAELRLWA